MTSPRHDPPPRPLTVIIDGQWACVLVLRVRLQGRSPALPFGGAFLLQRGAPLLGLLGFLPLLSEVLQQSIKLRRGVRVLKVRSLSYRPQRFTMPLLDVRVPGFSIAFSSAAVVLAQLFVSAPFFIRAARGGFARVEREIEEAAAIDGATPWQTFRLVTVPLALPALSSGLVLCWARAVGEFGATMMFAGNFIGRTQTMPLAVMGAMESDLYAALALGVLLIILAAVVLLLYRLIGGRRGVEL